MRVRFEVVGYDNKLTGSINTDDSYNLTYHTAYFNYDSTLLFITHITKTEIDFGDLKQDIVKLIRPNFPDNYIINNKLQLTVEEYNIIKEEVLNLSKTLHTMIFEKDINESKV